MSETPRPCSTDWEARWQAGDAPWDLGRAAPALEALVARLPHPARRVVVPGAGRGHDAVAWARGGHAVTALDIAPTAAKEGRSLAQAAGVEVAWVVGDLFDPQVLPPAAFDVVWEQTCFCAIDPARRAAYVERVADLLAADGTLYALLWNHGAPGGPPFDVLREDARAAFSARFDVQSLVDVEAWTRVRANEFLLTADRRS